MSPGRGVGVFVGVLVVVGEGVTVGAGVLLGAGLGVAASNGLTQALSRAARMNSSDTARPCTGIALPVAGARFITECMLCVTECMLCNIT